MNERPLITIVGPTGSGKSDLAIHLAQRFGGEVVNCDSLQVYRHFNIGTAKVPEHERQAVPHHLMDIRDPDALFTAGEYSRMARETIAGISARGHIPMVVGGTGFYLQALLHGLSPTPERDEDLRARMAAKEARRPGFTHRLLRRLDPMAASRIHARDVNKTIRAAEISLLARKPRAEVFEAQGEPLRGYAVLSIGLNPERARLYEKLNARLGRMFDEGLLDEVRAILATGYGPESKPFEALGYKQALAILDGRHSFADALEEARMHTRRYAKRQWTWFRRNNAAEWFDGFGTDAGLQHGVGERVATFLTTLLL